MKAIKILLILLVISNSSVAQNFNYMGSYSSNGTPNYLESTGDNISVSTMELIDSSLPETFQVPTYNPHYISSGYDTDLLLSAQSEVYVTFISEGAGFRNVLGYYTYDVNSPLTSPPSDEDVTIIFPNVSALGSGGGLEAGNKVSLGLFPAGTGIGWVLFSNAWNGSQVGYGYWQLYSNSDFNPEADESRRQHNVLIYDEDEEIIILGFEDINREVSWCDHDFNDAVFYVTATNFEDINTNNTLSSATASNVYSSNAGGFESNGNLANLMAVRSMDKMKSPNRPNIKSKQDSYRRSAFRSENLGSYFPQSGINGYETPYVATSLDLVNYANALDVFSVDYYAVNERVAAALITTTEGEIYDHGKTTCDRLNNSELLDLRTVEIKGHDVIFSILKRDDGNIEYAISFSIKEGVEQNELYSFWNLDSYPEGNFKNFQIWGASMGQVAHIVNFILDKTSSEKQLVSSNAKPKLPEVFVKSAYYRNQELHLEIINKSGVKSADLSASLKRTELSAFEGFETTIPLSGEWEDKVVVPTGYLFDVGFSFRGKDAEVYDALYLADGPWGIDYLEESVTLDHFSVHQQEIELEESPDTYAMERSASMAGKGKGTVNMFKTLMPGDLSMKVEDYDAISFSIQNNVPIEISLVSEDLADWEGRLRYQLPANQSLTSYRLDFTEFFSSAEGPQQLDKLKSVVFSVHSETEDAPAFDVEVRSLLLTINEEASFALSEELDWEGTNERFNYPNPFRESTRFMIPEGSTNIQLMILDLSGKVLVNQRFELSGADETVLYENKSLTKGLYHYVVLNQNQSKYTGSLLVK